MLIWSFSSKSFKFHNRTVLSRDPVNSVVPLFEKDVAHTSAFWDIFRQNFCQNFFSKNIDISKNSKKNPFPEWPRKSTLFPFQESITVTQLSLRPMARMWPLSNELEHASTLGGSVVCNKVISCGFIGTWDNASLRLSNRLLHFILDWFSNWCSLIDYVLQPQFDWLRMPSRVDLIKNQP